MQQSQAAKLHLVLQFRLSIIKLRLVFQLAEMDFSLLIQPEMR